MEQSSNQNTISRKRQQRRNKTMTDYFDDNSRRDLIKYRGQRSKNALDEAALLFEFHIPRT
jgi:hypothetical protein